MKVNTFDLNKHSIKFISPYSCAKIYNYYLKYCTFYAYHYALS